MNALDTKLKDGIEPFEVNDSVINQWQEVVNVVAKLMDVPACLIMRLNEKKIEVFSTSETENNPYEVKANEHFYDSGLYCETVIRTDDRLHVPFAPNDPNWEDNPDVPLNMLSYLGYPLKLPDSTPFGTICVLDSVERHYDEKQENLIVQFKDMIESHLKLERTTQELQEAQEETQNSINFASRLQQTLLEDKEVFNNFFEENFLIWKPKDVVSGDMYFVNQISDDEMYLTFVDCTGHGVAGAMVTMIVKTIQEQITSEIEKNGYKSPGEILTTFNKKMKQIFDSQSDSTFDYAGFDGIVTYINKKEKVMKFASAKMNMFAINDSKIEVFKGDRLSVGYKQSDINHEFKEQVIDLNTLCKFYLSTDGYWDQLGGADGFSFGKTNFVKTLEKIEGQSYDIQEKTLITTIDEYKKDETQIDDMMLLGFKL